MFKELKFDKEEGASLYSDLEKSAVLQEARIFNNTPMNARKCVQVLTKILVILSRGDVLTRNEATEAFFAMTKLFQCNNTAIRRMVYVAIKELADQADDVIIVTSSLTKDMNGPEMAFRGPAIRALCKITDPSMLQSIERFLKQAVVDKNPVISSAVLSCTYHMMRTSPDLVRKWSNEVQEAANSTKPMVQYHAIGLLYQIKKNDRQAITKMIHKFTRLSSRSPYAHCLLIRIVARQIAEDGLDQSRDLFDFLETSLRSKSEMVIFEAAKAIISVKGTTAKELGPAVSVLQLGCSSNQVMRYAAVKTLSMVATLYPAAVIACDMDLENLSKDSNRSIATLAVTTLLKTGSESNVERLLKNVFSMMADISDEFKLVVLESIRTLAMKFPKKFSVLLNFLSSLLRETSGYSFKKAVVLAFESILRDIPESKSLGLLLLCDFIEDCEHTELIERILHLIGQEGPFLKRPREFTRYIYNRVMLESAPVKCTATTALARFGAYNEELLPSILVLLQRIMLDEDDEVRDRAAFYHYLLSYGDRNLCAAYIMTDPMQHSAAALERALIAYTRDPSAHFKPFSLAGVPIEAPTDRTKLGPVDKIAAGFFELDKSAANQVAEKKPEKGQTRVNLQDQYANDFSKHPNLAKLGQIFKSSEPVALTETETEYVVYCVKHVMQQHLVLQFNCTNTMSDQVLTKISVSVTPDEEEFQVAGLIPIRELRCNQEQKAYAIVKLPEDASNCLCSFECCLKFTVHDVESQTDQVDDDVPGYEDEYPLEQVDLLLADHVQRVLKTNFDGAWQDMGDECEATETYSMSGHKSVGETTKQVIQHLGMQPCERTDQVSGDSTHQLLLAGVYRGGVEVLAKCKMLYAPGKGVALKIFCRSTDDEITRLLTESLG
ncbi:Coatomer subunit gamma-2 [Cichlidogyrus casuarinus]|uniref:Coatomer subunit gamma n=1 Tax=Cichlidogyrus casuarinus TaxID=1844966 RepID=A0ABD2Q7M4_9PLAT